jgi:hypothetical protein
MTITASQLSILQHSLGVDEYGRSPGERRLRDEGDGCGPYYRNRFVTSLESKDGKLCLELAAAGLMRDVGASQLFGEGNHCFMVTTEGMAVMRQQSPSPPKVSRGRRMYRMWRDLSEVCPGVSFLDFLTKPAFADARERAKASL